MKRDSFIKGVLVGIVIVLMSIIFTGFTSNTLGTEYNPIYVKVID